MNSNVCGTETVTQQLSPIVRLLHPKIPFNLPRLGRRASELIAARRIGLPRIWPSAGEIAMQLIAVHRAGGGLRRLLLTGRGATIAPSAKQAQRQAKKTAVKRRLNSRNSGRRD
jgi:hypothetical protein